MLNTTILYLKVLSIASNSPFYTMYNIGKGQLHLSVFNSQFSNLFNSAIRSYTYNHQTIIKNTIFSHTLSSAIKFSNEEEIGMCILFPNKPFEYNSPIDSQLFNGSTCPEENDCHLSYDGNCGNLTITSCTFEGCHSKSSGGSISVIQNNYIVIHSTTFNNSRTENGRFGAAVYIIRSKGEGHDKPEWADISDGQTKKLDVQYCCFSNCYGSDILMGVALMCAAEQTVLYFASTVNCPSEDHISRGAQFDIQADNITSHFVNCSGGYSSFCGGIEYRHASSGFFKKQTISGLNCMFAISYTNLKDNSELMKGIDFSDSNIIGINLKRSPNMGDEKVYSGLIHVRQTQQITINNFCFVDCPLKNENNDKQRIISKGTKAGHIESIKVIFNNCFYDCSNDMIAVDTSNTMLITNNCVPNTQTLNEIPQLFLGECKGKIKPVPYTPTKSEGFSDSKFFSHSDIFSNSLEFNVTDSFTNSVQFSKSNVFQPSKQFIKSDAFSASNYFTLSSKFQPTKEFIKTVVFSQSLYFSESNSFIEISTAGNIVDKGKTNVGMIAGITAGATAAVIAGIAAFFIIRKKRLVPQINDLETIDDAAASITNANPLYGKGEEDPFKDDFIQ